MAKCNYGKQIYDMYEEEHNEKLKIENDYKFLKLSYNILNDDHKKLKNDFDEKVEKEVQKAINPFLFFMNYLIKQCDDYYNEVNRLKQENYDLKHNKDNTEDCKLDENNIEKNKDYIIDKLTNQVNKDSTNSSISTSKEMKHNKKKNGANTYNHREKSSKTTGGQFNHEGKTLTKKIMEEKIESNNIEIREIIHNIKGNSNESDIVKYRVGCEFKVYVEKHIFKHVEKSDEVLPKEFYSDVTYCNDIRALIVILGNYFSLPYNKIKEFLRDISNEIIDISEGTIDNIYSEFSEKTADTINNITKNLLNGTYQHTDETTTTENGKDSYYRGYANAENVLYKYHNHKGDTPIKEDDILNNFIGTIIADHDVGVFKYGTNTQECIVHYGRYCNELKQNVPNIFWPMALYNLLLKFERNRKIISKFGRKEFTEEEIEIMENEFDDILEIAEVETENITSKYWKEKSAKLLKRSIKYKSTMLFYIHDFTVPYDNNFIERALRMIKGKTKVSGGFRSYTGGVRFGIIMSIIKTAILRKMSPIECIKDIFSGKVLFV